MRKTLVIGGPKHGQLVAWPTKDRYRQVVVDSYNVITGGSTSMRSYRLKQIVLFDRPAYIWLYEDFKFSSDESVWNELLMREILSYKGGFLYFSEVQDE